MKRLILLVILITVPLINYSCLNNDLNPLVTLEAQTLPITIHVEHAQNAAIDNVTNYTVQLDNQAAIPYPNVLDAVCSCIKTPNFVINDTNAHTIIILASNIWGSSTPFTINFKVTIPAKVTNGVLKVGA